MNSVLFEQCGLTARNRSLRMKKSCFPLALALRQLRGAIAASLDRIENIRSAFVSGS
jgi:hypothetical protein